MRCSVQSTVARTGNQFSRQDMRMIILRLPIQKVPLLHWMFDIEIDPVDAEDAMFTTGLGGWETFNLSAVERGDR